MIEGVCVECRRPPIPARHETWHSGGKGTIIKGKRTPLIGSPLLRQALNHEWIKNKAPRAQAVSLPQCHRM